MTNGSWGRKVVVTARTMSRVVEPFQKELRANGWEVNIILPEGQAFSSGDLAEAGVGAEAMIIGDDEASEEFFSYVAPCLRLLVKWGVGTDSIDFRAAERFGVKVHNTPGAFSNEVADLALAYVLALSRGVVDTHLQVVRGAWPQNPGTTLSGKTMGLIGFGAIGQGTAHRAQAFGMDVLFYDPYFAGQIPPGCADRGRDQIFSEADFVVLACPSTAETRGIINSKSLALMKPSSFLVNVARGDLVIEDDLVAALNNGSLAGAALDVYQHEPLPSSSELRDFQNVIFGAHNGSNTLEGLMRASSMATEIVLLHGMEHESDS